MAKGMIPIFCAVLIYAAFNAFLDQKMRGTMQVASISLYIFALLLCAGVAFLLRGPLELKGTLPDMDQVLWLLLFGFLLFVADWLVLTAYNEEVPLIIITTGLMMIPAFASIFKYFADGTYPTLREVCGYALVASGVYLVTTK